MDFEAQGSEKLLVLMLAGAVFAGAGLWLLLRPKPFGGTAKIELFGLKFESSSAGVLVFLIGAAFMALPLFVPEKAVVAQAGGSDKVADQSVKAGEPGETIAPKSGEPALILPPEPEVEEIEPNDKVQNANEIRLGQTVSGEVRKGNDDWFVVRVPDGPAFVDLQVRKVGGSIFRARLFNAREEKTGDVTMYELGSRYVRGEVLDNDRFYVLVWTDPNSVATANYEITLLPIEN